MQKGILLLARGGHREPGRKRIHHNRYGYNVPIEWTTNLDCSFTTKGTKVKGSKCFSVDCPDAYQHPTDDKQVACSADPHRWYVVTYCPAGSSMPNP